MEIIYEKKCIITGATGGIGSAIVDVLSKNLSLVLVARNEKILDELSSTKVIQ